MHISLSDVARFCLVEHWWLTDISHFLLCIFEH